MAGYTKDFLVDAFVSRYAETFKTSEELNRFREVYGSRHFDKVGKDQFRKDCSLDAAAIKLYKDSLK